MASVQPLWWNVTEQETTLKVWDHSAPDVDTRRGWELRRFFDHVYGTADVAKVPTQYESTQESVHHSVCVEAR